MNLEESQEERDLLKMRVIWGAFLLSPLMFLVVAWAILSAQESDPSVQEPTLISFSDPLGLAVSAFSLACFAAALNAHKFLPKKGAEPGAVPRDPQRPVEMESVLAPFVVRLALLETAAMCGLILALLRSEWTYMLPFVALSMVGFLLSFPSTRLLREIGRVT